MPLYAALAAVLVFLPSVISSKTDATYVFLVLPILVVVCICALLYAAFRRKLRLALMVATFCLVSGAIFLHGFEIRTFARWLLWSGQYKKEVLAQLAPPNGALKHIEWEASGWVGQDFTVFLVFDPTDSLSGRAQNDRSLKRSGIPCADVVSRVQRMESHWYLVSFDAYMDQSSWDSCK